MLASKLSSSSPLSCTLNVIRDIGSRDGRGDGSGAVLSSKRVLSRWARCSFDASDMNPTSHGPSSRSAIPALSEQTGSDIVEHIRLHIPEGTYFRAGERRGSGDGSGEGQREGRTGDRTRPTRTWCAVGTREHQKNSRLLRQQQKNSSLTGPQDSKRTALAGCPRASFRGCTLTGLVGEDAMTPLGDSSHHHVGKRSTWFRELSPATHVEV